MQQIPLETQTLFAELLEQLAIHDAQRAIGSLPGGFTAKEIKGERYLYFQYSLPGGQRQQVYLGKDSPALQSLIAEHQRQSDLRQADSTNIQRLCAQISVGGAITTPHAPYRVIQALADSGLFRMGGVLVGTHAFAAIGNLLGYRWADAGIMTQDIDVSFNRDVAIAIPSLPEADIPDTLERLKMGFFPVPALDPKSPSTSYKVRSSALRLDLLTPAKSRDEDYKTVPIKQLGGAAQALRYLDYLIEETVHAAVISGKGGALVNVPDPARYALHKVIVAQQRPAVEHTKRSKDFRQAALLLTVLIEERPGDLVGAWQGIAMRGEAWEKKVLAGIDAMTKQNPTAPKVADLKAYFHP